MRLFVHDFPGNPLHFHLSEILANHGVEVIHAYSPNYRGPKPIFVREDTPEGRRLQVSQVHSRINGRDGLVGTFVSDLAYGRSVVSQLRKVRPDAILTSNVPLDAQREISREATRTGVRHIYWMTDLRSLMIQSVLRRRLGLVGVIPSMWYKGLERSIVAAAEQVVCLSDDFVPLATQWRGSESDVSFVPPWGPVEDIPLVQRRNEFSRGLELDDKFVVLYAGTMGLKHDAGIILDLAQQCSQNRRVQFLVVSEGRGANRILRDTRSSGLDNITVLPFQPFDRLPTVLATADLLMAVLTPDASVMSTPSKVWAGMCAGRPHLLIMPRTNLAARTIQEMNGGIVVEPEAPERTAHKAAEWIHSLSCNPSECAQMGQAARAFAEREFSSDAVWKRFAPVLRLDTELS